MGNDTRALEAGAHAYAAKDGYGPLTTYGVTEAGDLWGEIEMPVPMGIVGGATKVHPTAQKALKIMGVDNADRLARVTASVGLIQNFSALRALATEGIQRGHMGLHARNVAIAAGAVGDDVERVAKLMIDGLGVREDVARTTEDYALSRDVVRAEAKAFGERLDAAVKTAEDSDEILDKDRITLGLIALAGFERDTILQRLREGSLAARMAEQTLLDADRLIEGARVAGRGGYQKAARRSVAYGRSMRIAGALHARFGVSFALARRTADRFELLLSQRLILRDLGVFIDGRIRRIHGRRVTDLLQGLLNRRIEMVETGLEGLRLQYPGYAEELERRFIRRTALRLEEREYVSMREDGLIGAEVFTTLMQDLSKRRAAAESRPSLDIRLKRLELIRQFPLFADLDDKAVRRLDRALTFRYVSPDDVVVRKENPVKNVFFIASGAVELESAGQTWRLGRGEMFGQVAILMKNARLAAVRAIAPTTLLVLDIDRFHRLLRKSAALQNAVRESGEKRGIDPDVLLGDVRSEV